MSGVAEMATCDFCHETKHVKRTYLRPSKYVEPEHIEDKHHLYNQGSYFIIVRTCYDCGVPKQQDNGNTERI